MVSKVAKYSRFVTHYAFPQGPRLAYIGGVYGSRNLGDEALRRAAAKLFDKCTLLEYPRTRRPSEVATRLLPVRNAVLAGGTLINQKDHWFDLVSAYVPCVQNFIVFGTGVAHPSFWNDRRKEWSALLNDCRFVGVRGPLSAELLSEANVHQVEVVGDPVLIFASDDQSHEYTPDCIGINIGWDREKQWGSQEQICAEAIRVAVLARDAGWKVRWFVVCPSDLELTSKLASASRTTGDIVVVYRDPIEYMREARACSVFVGTRLHAVVLATCAYVPSLMLEYRPKCRDYMRSIGQDDYIVRTDSFRAEEAWEKLLDMNAVRMQHSESLYSSMKPLRERQRLRAAELQKEMLTANR